MLPTSSSSLLLSASVSFSASISSPSCFRSRVSSSERSPQHFLSRPAHVRLQTSPSCHKWSDSFIFSIFCEITSFKTERLTGIASLPLIAHLMRRGKGREGESVLCRFHEICSCMFTTDQEEEEVRSAPPWLPGGSVASGDVTVELRKRVTTEEAEQEEMLCEWH